MNFKLKGGEYSYKSRRSYETIQSIHVFPRCLTAFNYAGLNLNETPQELEKCNSESQNFWEKECREHPTNQNCLIYCD